MIQPRYRLVLAGLLIVFTGACAHHRPRDGGRACTIDGYTSPCLPESLAAAGLDRAALSCNSGNVFGEELRADAKKAAAQLMGLVQPHLEGGDAGAAEELQDELVDAVTWWMVRAILIEGNNNNLGAVVLEGYHWTDEAGLSHPVTVLRTGFTPDPLGQNSCYRSLLEAGRVRHVVNLYDGEMVVDDLVGAERAVAEEVGATYVVTRDLDYGEWRNALRTHLEDGPEREEALRAVGRLIREQVLMPGGGPPKGNILIHCGGGMHRTGMIVGILQRHVNGEPMDEVARAYRFHVDYQGPDHVGGLEEDNLEVIRDFDSGYLQ